MTAKSDNPLSSIKELLESIDRYSNLGVSLGEHFTVPESTMIVRRRWNSLSVGIFLAIVAIAVGLVLHEFPANPRAASAAVGHEGPPDDPSTFAEVAWYAKTFGVSEAEALRRGRLQEQSLAIRGPLRALAPDRVSAVWLQHESEFKLIAWYTGETSTLPDTDAIVRNAPLPVEIRGGAPFSEVEGLEILSRLRDNLPDGIDAAGIGIEASTGTIVLELQPSSKFVGFESNLADSLAPLADAPVKVVALTNPASDDTTYGGKRISSPIDGTSCTTGFTVTGVWATGVSVAAHCEAQSIYWETPTISFSSSFMSQSWGPTADVQWRTVDGPETNQFYDGTGYRTLTGQAAAWQQLGNTVCRYGINTGTQCTWVTMSSYTPTWDDACHGSPCSSTWMRTYGAATDGGDSGVPYFWFGTAYGTVKGHAGETGVYMAIQYLANIGVSLLY